MKLYKGTRKGDGCNVTVTTGEGKTYDLPLKLELASHSITGFEWGYRGSGPTQLALAMVADVTGDDAYALENYKEFRDLVTSRLIKDGWEMTEPKVLEFILFRKPKSP